MTGAEHYREAERLLAAHDDNLRLLSDALDDGNLRNPGDIGIMHSQLADTTAMAQAHATLALAAITGGWA